MENNMKYFLVILTVFIYCGILNADTVQIAPQIDPSGWQTIISNSETETTDAFDPFNASGVTALDMAGSNREGKYTGIQIRSKFTAIGRTQNPVIACFGRKISGSTTYYSLLKDANGQTSITISPTDDTTIEKNTNDDTSYWSTPSEPIDARGSDNVVCTVVTAATAGTGDVAIEASRY